MKTILTFLALTMATFAQEWNGTTPPTLNDQEKDSLRKVNRIMEDAKTGTNPFNVSILLSPIAQVVAPGEWNGTTWPSQNDNSVSSLRKINKLLNDAKTGTAPLNMTGGVDLSAPGPIGGTTPGAGAFTALSTTDGLDVAVPGTADQVLIKRNGTTLIRTGDNGSSLSFENRALSQVGAITIAEAGYIQFNGPGPSAEILLWRDATNRLALRRTGSYQDFAIYSNFTDVSNYDTLQIATFGDGDDIWIQHVKAGTGATRKMNIISSGTMGLGTGGSERWTIDGSGHLASAGSSDVVLVTGGSSLRWGNSTKILDSFDGGMELRNNASTLGVHFGANSAGFQVGSALATSTTIVAGSSTPASAAAAGVKGEIRWDANFIYVCVATNTWKRVAIATW